MGVISPQETLELKINLQRTLIACSERCLYQSAKWTAELLSSMAKFDLENKASEQLEVSLMSIETNEWDSKLEKQERLNYLLAKSFFDCREFDRCAAVFLPSTIPNIPPLPSVSSSDISDKSPDIFITKGKGKATSYDDQSCSNPVDLPCISRKSLFLALYAQYLAGEKRKDEESEMILGPMDSGMMYNRELKSISAMLERWFTEHRDKDGGGWLEYLYAVVLIRGKNEDAARHFLIRSVQINPYIWATWQELASLLSTSEELIAILDLLPENIMTLFFNIYASQELYLVTEGVHTQLALISKLFPNSAFLQTMKALLFYHAKEFETSCQIFTSIIHAFPYRLDSLDVFSNILYVMSNRPLLSFLAYLTTLTDKFRPETCCVVGNYYSLLSSHEKAVMYFRRALSLDRSFSAAWTLMGHEYVEMKNTHAAIESYRRAVDANRRDYRAWYGLGQTYEFLEMQSYALFYYQRAASLRPFDPKMWAAIGACLSRIGKFHNAIKAYKRALETGSYYDESGGSLMNADGVLRSEMLGGGVLDPDILYQVALLYERMGNHEETAAYMELVLAQETGITDAQGRSDSQMDRGVGVTPTTSKARMWLARWEFLRTNFQRSMELANELCQDGVEVEEAKALIRDIRARIEMSKDSLM